MAAHNAEDDIEGALEALLAQTYSNLEVIVADDASSDETMKVVERIAERDPRVRSVTRKTEGGAAAARNLGLRHAAGEFITFQDSDDQSDRERIEKQLAALIENRASLCVCNSDRRTPSGERVIINGRRFAKAVNTMMVPRSPVLERIGYMRNLRVGEDSEFYQRALAAFGRDSEVWLFETLLHQKYSADSLLFSNGQTAEKEMRVVEHSPSEEVRRALDEALQDVEAIRRGEQSPFVPYAE
jgi:glycosyltransferase involved in cell wall biosynthesis